MSREIPGILADALSVAFGATVAIDAIRPLSGGCINNAARIETSRGVFFAKWNSGAPPNSFGSEAASLEALAAAPSDLVVPRVVAFGDGAPMPYLIAEYVEPGHRVADFAERLGRGLAGLHQASAVAFGFEIDTYCGTTLQPNDWTSDWISFFAEHRLGYQARLAVERGCLTKRESALLESIVARLDVLLGGAAEPPALIHGDLWSGNIHATPHGLPAIIDPAACFAHREMEFGIMFAFGVADPVLVGAYEEVSPFVAGWRQRNVVYRLYHLMNHLNIFGSSYHSAVVSILESLAGSR